ncbi:MAG TPA: amino acid permease, partial [Myxococcales bacterium]
MLAAASGLVRRIGLFDATMIVMGGIVGSGIFVTPADVARSAGSPALILGAWVVGGVAALLGAFVYAELSSARPEVGGQYAYLREAVHPLAAFLYGWALLLVIQTGGMAATAIAFARYFRELLPIPLGEGAVAAGAVGTLTIVNCLGVRAGSTAQSALMVLKICALGALIGAGLLFGGVAPSSGVPGSPAGFGAALIPVLFAYGGWQTACFVAGEMKDPRRDLPRALLLGVAGVIALYTLVAFVCLRT